MGRNGISVQIIRYHQVSAIWGRSSVAFFASKKATELRPQMALAPE